MLPPNVSVSSSRHSSFNASAQEIMRLAEAYHRSGLALIEAGRGGDAVGRAPGRYCAIHAIELYLDAFLRAAGETPCRLRVHGHDLGRRAALAIGRGLDLRRKTALHLVQMSRQRDHLVVRYGPECLDAVCEINRLVASLTEIARKVRASVLPDGGTGEAAA
jgi:hypothetical protein